MPEPRLARPDRILVAAEVHQPVCQKIVERRAGVGRRDRPVEVVEAARVLREPRGDELQDLLRHRVGREPARRWQLAGAGLGKRPAVLGVVVPRSPRRLAVVHQDAELLPQRTVEVLEPELLAALGVGGELVGGREEVPVGADLERQPRLPRRRFDRLPHPPFPRLDDDEFFREPLGFSGRGQARGKRGGERGRFTGPWPGSQFGVVDLDSVGHQRVAEVPHRGEKHRDPSLVRPDVGALLGHLGHPDPITGPVKAVEGRTAPVELVAEDDHKLPHG